MKLAAEITLLDCLADNPKIPDAEKILPEFDAYKPAEGWLQSGIARGDYTAKHVAFDGRVIGSIIYSMGEGDGKILRVNACVAYEKGNFLPTFMRASEFIARVNDCTRIEFVTRRLGLIEESKKYGYNAGGLVMTKILT